MGLGISWKKAAIISAVVHLIALFIAVIFFVVVPAIQEMDTYEIDLTQSVLDDGGSGHAGGGGGNRADLFPKPLSADEVAARTKAVVANVEPSTATDIPDAVDVAAKASENKGNTSGDNSAVGGTGLELGAVLGVVMVPAKVLALVMVEAMVLVQVMVPVKVMVMVQVKQRSM